MLAVEPRASFEHRMQRLLDEAPQRQATSRAEPTKLHPMVAWSIGLFPLAAGVSWVGASLMGALLH